MGKTYYIFVEDRESLPSLDTLKAWAGTEEAYNLGLEGEQNERQLSYSHVADAISSFMDEFYNVGPGEHAYTIVIKAERLSDLVALGLSECISETVVDEDDQTAGLCQISNYSNSLYSCIDNMIGDYDEIESIVRLACDESLCDDPFDISQTCDRVQRDIWHIHDSLMSGVKQKFEAVSGYKGIYALSK